MAAVAEGRLARAGCGRSGVACGGAETIKSRAMKGGFNMRKVVRSLTRDSLPAESARPPRDSLPAAKRPSLPDHTHQRPPLPPGGNRLRSGLLR